MFIALDITTNDKHAIATWRAQNLVLPAKIIPDNNFHITLAFLGVLNEYQQQNIEHLIQEKQSIIQEILSEMQPQKPLLTLKKLGYFHKAQVLHLMPCECPYWLTQLQKIMTNICQKAEIPLENRPYQPHISLYRKVKSSTVLPATLAIDKLLPLDNYHQLNFNSFSLYHSKSTTSGVFYTPERIWKLNF